MFASTGLIAGALGMPFMGLFAGLYNQLGTLFQDKDDEPPDFEKGIRDGRQHVRRLRREGRRAGDRCAGCRVHSTWT
jgi:hypothetical protein